MALVSEQIWRWKENARKDMTSIVRHNAPGDTALIGGRVTHYRLDGAPEQPLLICIHGWTTASYVWEPLRPFLQQKGYRVLTYDLYGRGYSDRPIANHTAGFFVRQLNELLEHLNLNDQPFSVVGYSMGGAVAARFAYERMQQTERLLLIAPAGMAVRAEEFRRILRKYPRLLNSHILALLPPLLRRQFRKEAAPYRSDPFVRAVEKCQRTRVRISRLSAVTIVVSERCAV